MATTTRLGIPLASLDEDADVEESVNPGFEHIDKIMARDGQGPLVDVPPPTTKLRGAYYWVTDARVLLRCDGIGWRAVVEFPVGGVVDWPASTEPPTPSGDLVMWLEMSGQTVQRAVFPELAAAWGINAAAFRIPNRSGRTQIGAGQATQGTTGRTVGQVGGEERHTISKAELPAYDLPVTDPGHSHPYDRPGGRTAQFGADPDHATFTGVLFDTKPAKTGITVGSGGSGQAANVMQPFNVTRYFVRAR